MATQAAPSTANGFSSIALSPHAPSDARHQSFPRLMRNENDVLCYAEVRDGLIVASENEADGLVEIGIHHLGPIPRHLRQMTRAVEVCSMEVKLYGCVRQKAPVS